MTISFLRGNFADGGASSLSTLQSTYSIDGDRNLLVASVGWVDGGTITASIADDQGNNWRGAAPKLRNATQGYSIQTFYCYTTRPVAGTVTVTLTVSAATTFLRLHLHEYS